MPRTINRVDRVGAEPEMRYGRHRRHPAEAGTDRRTGRRRLARICWGKLAEAVHEYVEQGRQSVRIGKAGAEQLRG